jgi:hypothetical protein
MRLCRGNWVFEDTLTGQPALALIEDIELGPWWYRNVSGQLIEVRQVPTRGNWARSGYVICPNEACVVTLRGKIFGVQFMLLTDGRGWIFEKYPFESGGKEVEEYVMVECDRPPQLQPQKQDSVVASKTSSTKTQLPRSLQTGSWIYKILDKPVLALGTRLAGAILDPGEQVHVNARISANGIKTAEVSSQTNDLPARTWLKLGDGRGWIPKVDEVGRPLVQFIRGSDGPVDLDTSFASSSMEVSASTPCGMLRAGVA